MTVSVEPMSRWKLFISRVGRMTLWQFAVIIWFWYIFRWWPGDELLIIRLISYVIPWFLLILLPGAIVAGLARRKWLTLALVVPALLIIFTNLPLFLPNSSSALASGMPLKMMSYNLFYRNKDTAAIVAQVKQEQPDILLLQELNSQIARKLADELSQLYPEGEFYFAWVDEVEHPRPFSQAVVSRYPLTPLGQSYEAGRLQKVQVETSEGIVTVFNVHPTPRTPHTQIRLLVEEIAAVSTPLIVGGDFNVTDQTNSYSLIDHYLDNAHWEAGWGFAFTFPSRSHVNGQPIKLRPIYRIDHIFYSAHFSARHARTLEIATASDHLPITAELVRIR